MGWRICAAVMFLLQLVFSGSALAEDSDFAFVFLCDARKNTICMTTLYPSGQKMLMLGDDFWLVLPSKAPVRRVTLSRSTSSSPASAATGRTRSIASSSARSTGWATGPSGTRCDGATSACWSSIAGPWS